MMRVDTWLALISWAMLLTGASYLTPDISEGLPQPCDCTTSAQGALPQQGPNWCYAGNLIGNCTTPIPQIVTTSGGPNGPVTYVQYTFPWNASFLCGGNYGDPSMCSSCFAAQIEALQQDMITWKVVSGTFYSFGQSNGICGYYELPSCNAYYGPPVSIPPPSLVGMYRFVLLGAQFKPGGDGSGICGNNNGWWVLDRQQFSTND
jgi:hypothetical protein